MTVRLIDWLGRSLLHERTVALIIEPALADWSFEIAVPSSGRRPLPRLGPWVALAMAVWHDLVWDPRGPAWGRSLRVAATLSLVIASYHASMLTLMLGFEPKWRTSFTHQLSATVSSQPVLVLLAITFAFGVAWSARRAHAADGPP